MEGSTAIFIPTFGRSNRLAKVQKNIDDNTPEPHSVYFIVEKGDYASFDACIKNRLAYMFNEYTPSYAGAINTAYERTHEPFFFVASDDLNFHKGWLTKCFEKMVPGIEVVGTNDLLNKDVLAGKAATHYLVSRKYIQQYVGTLDKSYPVLYAYKHNYTDTEFIETAKKRGVFAPCLEAVVEHMHYAGKKNVFDKTYEKNQSTYAQDKKEFEKRRWLWQ